MRVPHAEMTDAITVKDAAKQRLKPGAYVRVQTAGVYKGDLAQVVNIEAGGGCMIKLVPRVDLTAMQKRCVHLQFVRHSETSCPDLREYRAKQCGYWCSAQEREAGGVSQPFGRAEKGALRPAAVPFSPEAANALGLIVDRRRTTPHGAFSGNQEGEEYTFVLHNRRFINGYEVCHTHSRIAALLYMSASTSNDVMFVM